MNENTVLNASHIIECKRVHSAVMDLFLFSSKKKKIIQTKNQEINSKCSKGFVGDHACVKCASSSEFFVALMLFLLLVFFFVVIRFTSEI